MVGSVAAVHSLQAKATCGWLPGAESMNFNVCQKTVKVMSQTSQKNSFISISQLNPHPTLQLPSQQHYIHHAKS